MNRYINRTLMRKLDFVTFWWGVLVGGLGLGGGYQTKCSCMLEHAVDELEMHFVEVRGQKDGIEQRASSFDAAELIRQGERVKFDE